MMAIDVRNARRDDADQLVEMIRKHAAFERGKATISRAELAHILSEKSDFVHIIVAADKENLCGYASLTKDYSLWRNHIWAHLDCLFVQPEMRSRGVGALLFSRAKLFARESGADRIEWQTPDWNVRAGVFYKREGASVSAKTRFGLDL